MSFVKMSLNVNGEDKVVTVDQIVSADLILARGFAYTLCVQLSNVCYVGKMLGKKDKTSELIDMKDAIWMHLDIDLLFRITKAESLREMTGVPVLVIWKNDGGPGDMVEGIVSLDGSIILI